MNKERNIKRAKEAIDALSNEYESEIKRLRDENDFFNSFSHPKDLLPYKNNDKTNNPDKLYWPKFEAGHLKQGFHSYDNNIPDFIKNDWTVEKCEKLIEESTEIHEKNLEIIKQNKIHHDIIMSLLLKIGLKKSRWIYRTSRSRNTTETRCLWVSEVAAMYSTGDIFPALLRSYESAIKKIKEYDTAKASFLKKEELEKKKESEEKEELVYLSNVNTKFDLGIKAADLSNDSVFESLIRKDKYLYLGYYLYKNRCDWNDGHYYADTGLSFFESSEQKGYSGVEDLKIIKDIQDRIEDWYGDGRTFRDSEYGYNYCLDISSKTNPKLYAEYKNLIEKVDI